EDAEVIVRPEFGTAACAGQRSGYAHLQTLTVCTERAVVVVSAERNPYLPIHAGASDGEDAADDDPALLFRVAAVHGADSAAHLRRLCSRSSSKVLGGVGEHAHLVAFKPDRG